MARRKKKKENGLLQKGFRVTVKGVSKLFFVYGHTEQELTEKEQAKRQELARGIEKIENPTIEEYFERWQQARQGTVKETTQRTQAKAFGVMAAVEMESLFGMAFGQIKIRQADAETIRELQRKLKETRKSRTVNDYMALLKHIFTDAYKERLTEFNPCIVINNFKQTEEQARDTNHRALTIEEQTAFFACDRCKNSYYYNAFRFAILTGARAGEIGALKYADISKECVRIERTITRQETGAYMIGTDAKTKAGRRDIPLNDQLREVIKAQKEFNKLVRGNVLALDELLFKAPEGGLMMVTMLDREIKKICTAANIEPFTMHALRATFATRCIESGMNPKTLQEILGHSNFNITMSLYGHAMETTKKEELSKVEIAF